MNIRHNVLEVIADKPLDTIDVKWEYEDRLPLLSDAEYSSIFGASRVIDYVRMFPYYIDNCGDRVWLAFYPLHHTNNTPLA